MNNDLISREALKIELRQQLAYHKEKAKLTTINNDKMAHSLVATGIQLALDIIDNAPTIKPYCYFCGQAEHGREVERPKGDFE